MRFGTTTDELNVCMQWAKRKSGGFNGKLCFDIVSLRMRRRKVDGDPQTALPPSEVAIYEWWVGVWKKSKALVGFAFGSRKFNHYRRCFPDSECVRLLDTALYGKYTLCFIE